MKLNTILTKKCILYDKVLPFFEEMEVGKITPILVRDWQNEMLSSKTKKTNKLYSKTYIRTINNSLVAIFNYAVKYHNLRENPCHKAGTIGSKKTKEMNIWTIDQFQSFVNELEEKPVSYIGFNILFWTGIRIGELFALTKEDIDLNKRTIRINKSCQRIGREDVITEPKTQKSNRYISITKKLCLIIEKYLSMLYNVTNTERIIKGSKQTFRYDMKIYAPKVGVPKIRIHNLRHSHASMLINLGINPLSIAKRLGHEKIETTLNIYSHLYPEQEKNMIDLLEKLE